MALFGMDYLLLSAMLSFGSLREIRGLQGDICKNIPYNKTNGYCERSSYKASCEKENLQQVPRKYPGGPPNLRLCFLDLGYNNISKLDEESFANAVNLKPGDVRILYLNNNNMRVISGRAFEGLHSLLSLNLKSNWLESKTFFGKGILDFTPALRELNLKKNFFTTFDTLDEEFSALINLTSLSINPTNDTFSFGAKFKNLKKLTRISLSGKSESDCRINNVKARAFLNVPKLTSLGLSCCNIQNIENVAFKPLTKLKYLDISYNEELLFKGMNTALAGLRDSASLNTLNVNRLHVRYEYGIKVHLSDFENLRTLKNLRNLYMDLNKIEVFDERIFNVEDNNTYSVPPKLERITLSGNRLTYGKYVETLFMVRGVKMVDISRQNMRFDPYFRKQDVPFFKKLNQIYNSIDMPEAEKHLHLSAVSSLKKTDLSRVNFYINCSCNLRAEKDIFCVPTDIQRLHWKRSSLDLYIPPFLVCSANSLKFIDLSQNVIQKWQGPVFGLSSLEELRITDNFCLNVTSTFFLAFLSLKSLNISGNLFSRSFDQQLYKNADKMFVNLGKLTTLDISRSGLYTLPPTIFNYLPNIENLILSDNDFVQWTASLENCRHIKLLDLSGNLFDKIPVGLTNYLDSLASNENRNVTLNFANNPLECSCSTLKVLRWVVRTNVVVILDHIDHCKINGKRMVIRTESDVMDVVHTLENLCKDKSYITWLVGSGSIVIGMFLSFLLCLVVYRNRWKLRYIYYSRHRRYRHQGYDNLFSTDAFISYSQNKASFIKNRVVPVLEGQFGLKLWVADRNAIPGISVADNITHAIYSCRKTVLMIDSNYLMESWCDYEMNMAIVESVETKRKLILVVLMEPFQTDKLPTNILRFLKNEELLEYPENEQDLDAFWGILYSEIQKE